MLGDFCLGATFISESLLRFNIFYTKLSLLLSLDVNFLCSSIMLSHWPMSLMHVVVFCRWKLCFWCSPDTSRFIFSYSFALFYRRIWSASYFKRYFTNLRIICSLTVIDTLLILYAWLYHGTDIDSNLITFWLKPLMLSVSIVLLGDYYSLL